MALSSGFYKKYFQSIYLYDSRELPPSQHQTGKMHIWGHDLHVKKWEKCGQTPVLTNPALQLLTMLKM